MLNLIIKPGAEQLPFFVCVFCLTFEQWRSVKSSCFNPELIFTYAHATRLRSPSEQTKHQLTLMCSWFLQPLRGVKWFGQRKLLFASTKLPAAMQLSFP